MIQKEDIKTMYSDSDPRVIEFLENIIIGLNGSLPDYMKTNLDLLNTQLRIYFKALDRVYKEDLVMTTQKGPKPNPILDILQRTHSRILELMKEAGITRASKTRIERMMRSDNTEDTDKLIEMLTA